MADPTRDSEGHTMSRAQSHAPQSLPSSAFATDVARAFTNVEHEHGFVPLRVTGELPAALRGTLYRNGPGLFELFGRRYDHWFEGDGAVSAVRFADGGALGALKVVQSDGLKQERAAGKMLFGTSVPWAQRVKNALGGHMKNTANTSVMFWQDRLFALMEAALPTELDPDTLDTLGALDLGVIESAFSAHPHRVHGRRATYNFGVRYGKQTFLDCFELPDVGAQRKLCSVPLAAPVMLHDFIATDRHLVFFVSPAKVVLWRFFLQLGAFTDLFAWDAQAGTDVIVVPIDAPDDVVRFTVDSFYQWHFANAFERAGEIVVDYCRYPDFSSFTDLGSFSRGDATEAKEQGHLHRSLIDLRGRRLTEEILDDSPTEFPKVAPRVEGVEHRFLYLATAVGDEALLKIDLETGARRRFAFDEGIFPSEPVFVPHPDGGDEDRGWLLSLLYDGREHQSRLAVFDAQRLEDGPLGEAHFDHAAPLTFHGVWRPG
jgi:all-trans-8'-apo-beta-carotenal 15,15'-oxygenase